MNRPTKCLKHTAGLTWELDLTEAIDFCIWLTGSYEPDLREALAQQVKLGHTVVDIGANVGAHTLVIAQLVGDQGHVHAIEATAWGISRIQRQLELNPHLKNRVTLHHAFLLSGDDEMPKSVSASWSLVRASNDPQKHQLDQGFAVELAGAQSFTFDQWCQQNQINKIDIIKLDVDGHEVTVLGGAAESLRKYGPLVFMELSPIHYEGHRYTFADQVKLLTKHGYRLGKLNGDELPQSPESLEKMIPRGVLLNVLGRPQ